LQSPWGFGDTTLISQFPFFQVPAYTVALSQPSHLFTYHLEKTMTMCLQWSFLSLIRQETDSRPMQRLRWVVVIAFVSFLNFTTRVTGWKAEEGIASESLILLIPSINIYRVSTKCQALRICPQTYRPGLYLCRSTTK
jgi:hypothetical protein